MDQNAEATIREIVRKPLLLSAAAFPNAVAVVAAAADDADLGIDHLKD